MSLSHTQSFSIYLQNRAVAAQQFNVIQNAALAQAVSTVAELNTFISENKTIVYNISDQSMSWLSQLQDDSELSLLGLGSFQNQLEILVQEVASKRAALVERASTLEKERERLGSLLGTLVITVLKTQQSLNTFSLGLGNSTEAEIESLDHRLARFAEDFQTISLDVEVLRRQVRRFSRRTSALSVGRDKAGSVSML